MKNTVLKFGLISGFISIIGFLVMHISDSRNFENGMIYGFASMIVAFSFIFVAIKTYRDKQNGGTITFGKAFQMGLYISLIASTIYVVTWLITLYNFIPDFADKYAAYSISQMQADGASPAEVSKAMAEMQEFKETYKSPVMVVLWTYMEILPIALLFTLLASAILKKKPQLAM